MIFVYTLYILSDSFINSLAFLSVMREKYHVLLVEDEPAFRELLEDFLEISGYRTVTSVASGDDALRSVEAGGVDVVVMDTEMEGMRGYEACSLIKETPYGSDIIVIGMSGSSDQSYRSIWSGAKSDSFLSKMEISTSPGYLGKTIDTLVGLKN